MDSSEDARMAVGRCPSCDTRIRFQEWPQLYQGVRCPECGRALEVKSERPLRLVWAVEESATESVDW